VTTFASIDIGTNSIRLAIIEVKSRYDRKLLHKSRESVRLGREVFTSGRIGRETLLRAVRVCEDFKNVIDQYGVAYTKAVSTSAVREAQNGDVFLDRVMRSSGIEVKIISWKEEARLIHRAIREEVDFQGRTGLLIDVGGGSVEVTIATQDEVLSSQSYNLGPVRLLHMLDAGSSDESAFFARVREYVQTRHTRIQNRSKKKEIDFCVATGGSIETLDELHRQFYPKHVPKRLPVNDLGAMLEDLSRLSIVDRVKILNLPADRADVIVPASILLDEFAAFAGVDEIYIPHCGLQDGLLLDLVSKSLKRY